MVSRPLESPVSASETKALLFAWGPYGREVRLGFFSCRYVREIGDVDEGVVEGGEDTSDAKDELTWRAGISHSRLSQPDRGDRGILTLADLGAQGDVLLGGLRRLLGGHFRVCLAVGDTEMRGEWGVKVYREMGHPSFFLFKTQGRAGSI